MIKNGKDNMLFRAILGDDPMTVPPFFGDFTAKGFKLKYI